MEADYDDFVIHQAYLEAMPRPNYEENQALDLKLIQRGQQEPIKVNRKMWILDGYTRHDLLGQRGKKIKYMFMDFNSSHDEWEYVVETNVMRRQLNKYQRIEAMYGMYKNRKQEIKNKNYDGWIAVMQSVKKGNTTAIDVAEDIGYHRQAINKISRVLEKNFYIRRIAEFRKHESGKGRGGTTYHILSLLPKSEEFLSKHTKRQMGSASVLIGKIIGLHRNTVVKGMTIVEQGDEGMKRRLRDGELTMNNAYAQLVNIGHREGIKYTKRLWKNDSNIRCPHCDRVSKKSEYILEV